MHGVSLHGVCAKLEAMLLAYSVTCMAAELNLHKYFVKPDGGTREACHELNLSSTLNTPLVCSVTCIIPRPAISVNIII